MPTSILMELLLSGGIRNECTQTSLSLVTSAIRREIVTRTKYLHMRKLVSAIMIVFAIPELDIDPLVALILLLHIFKQEVERLRLSHLPGSC